MNTHRVTLQRDARLLFYAVARDKPRRWGDAPRQERLKFIDLAKRARERLEASELE